METVASIRLPAGFIFCCLCVTLLYFFYILIYFLLFAQDHFPLQLYFIHYCSIIIEQEVSEAYLGLSRRPPLLYLKRGLTTLKCLYVFLSKFILLVNCLECE